jgi:heme/copper-type cytochrome/quinol oxidase subunit 2
MTSSKSPSLGSEHTNPKRKRRIWRPDKNPRLRFGLVCLLATLPACDRPDRAFELPTPLVIRATGRDFYWRFTYPGRDGTIGTADDIQSDQDVHVPLGHPVKIDLASQDYVYTFRAPELGLHEIAVPELSFAISFTAEKPGRYKLEVDPLCGYVFAHDNDSMGQLVVEPVSDVSAWLARSAR